MKRVCLLVCCAVLSGCIHSAPGEVKKDSATPLPAVKQEKPDLSASLVEKSITKGKTTKGEITAVFGPPNAVEPNRRRPTKEMLANVKTELPPIAYTKEFWNYWKISDLPAAEGGKEAQSTKKQVFRVIILFDDNDIAVDYQTSESTVDMQ